MGATVQASDGAMLPLDSLPQQFLYDGDFISSITVFYQYRPYVQTFMNDGTNIIYISNWIYTPVPPGGQFMTDESGDIMVDESDVIMVTES